ncbi:receptor-like serine/threonine-protein kinase NCRK [Andrographis paniculata]|uniref:receptor-like serine/threonine-protein kinase NCRK n=1 Tax=Andrographis paniculata TaxID=175694 RepID=UPI0021E73320|nr:receptor-like serine/threonine-protein kinase NCRK [Andrographis paniculata]XP_051134125.1 receptor-like serine/threonine-protein kinase NCRK [Andrographis paniculata]XP_051134126.1 receptor-like serine/threonine-protein kinase NCRK [Andrographis paniculata]XP_051134127.1 receptor-like serine/threonine-protein kinase NCRK [Andrographis paniculata]XP_051134128.1 receptor-like serine/threonine-protein kinase NCRK [Andrographis paniculata]
MGLHSKFAFFCIINAIWIQNCLCDELAVKSKADNWTCICSVVHHADSNFISTNCSSSCDCSPAAGGSTEDRWSCVCSSGELPRLVSDNSKNSCFTACNCDAGALSELRTSKKHIGSKLVLIVLLLCIFLTAIAIIGSVMWYLYRKEKSSVLWTLSPSERLTSCSSATNLTSRAGSSVSVYKGHVDSSFSPFLGCIPKTNFLFRDGKRTIHGTLIQFSYLELESATSRFSDTNIIGVGGSSHVYCGNLRDGRVVAIKRMRTQSGPDAEHVFLTEIELISRLHHCHVVPLLGYCSEHQGKHAERLLVFEYIPNGNLRECLDRDTGQCLSWNTRISVALGAARGLEYLHDAAAPRILHRDVKSTNILLDENWRAKITDLGMAKHLHNDGILSCSSSPARMQGTFGYFAPEYAIIGRASLKSDVFSFGVVLLELITGRNPIQKSSNKGEESLVIWAQPLLHDSKRVISELPDPRLEGRFQEEEMQVMAYLAKECLLLDPDSRPSMSEVVQILSTIAPDKSKRKNLSMHAFQRHSSSSSYGGMNPVASDDEYCDSSVSEEIKQITSEIPVGGSIPANAIAGAIPCDEKGKEADGLSSASVENLTLLTSKSRSCRVEDDVVVDLTEPRFESFCLSHAD